MILREIAQDLFNLAPRTGALVHCVSADCAMGAGIALRFRTLYPGNTAFCKAQNPPVGTAVRYVSPDGEVIYNLVTKAHYWEKPTYESLESALKDMEAHALRHKDLALAMPRIGCGLDRLEWGKVKSLLQQVFGDVDITITICRPSPKGGC